MNVKDIFALRKQGKIEEAYEAIRPIYREHKGRFTTLCMFWVASDVFKLRLEQGRVEEAEKIYEALKRLVPKVDEIDEGMTPPLTPPLKGAGNTGGRSSRKRTAAGFMHYAEGRLIKASEKFRKRYFAIKKSKKQYLSTPPLTPPLERRGIIPSDNPSEPALIPLKSPSEEVLSKGQQTVLECIKSHPGMKVPGIENETSIPAKSVERHIKVLIERRLIEHRGSKKTGGYYPCILIN